MNNSLLGAIVIAFLCICYMGLYILPFDFFVRPVSLTAHDVCVGDAKQLYTNVREPRWGIQGSTFSQVVKFDGLERIETTIDRTAHFGYEPNTREVSYFVEWSHPLEIPGVYGANEWIIIYPLPFIEITKYTDASDLQFNVMECD